VKLVLLSGGSGKRLWPLSNDSRSKQFLKVLHREGGELESMVQRVWRQLGEVNLQHCAHVATSKSQTEVLRNQLGDQVPVITEPGRRDTFPAIMLAASYLYAAADADPDETVVVLPVDPFVEAAFFERIKQLDEIIAAGQADIALMGVKPTHPSEKYGYIVPAPDSGEQSDFRRVSHFREKPRQDQAAELIQRSALWNCGVFAFKLRFAISMLARRGYPVRHAELLEAYGQLPKISFDHEVVEKNDRIAVLSYDGFWKDLGTWNTLTEEMKTRQIGIGVVSEDSHDTHLINELDVPVTIAGLSGIVVAASPDGILVADKASTPRLKEYVQQFDLRPMYAERRWGCYRVIDYAESPDGRKALTRKIRIGAGKNLSYHFHYWRSEIWTILSGTGELILNENLRSVSAGDVIHIPQGSRHTVRAIEDLEMIEIQTGADVLDEDIDRLALAWDDIVRDWAGVEA